MYNDSNAFLKQFQKVDYYPLADMWGDIVKTLHSTGWLDIMSWNIFLERSVILDALPFLHYAKPTFGITQVQVGKDVLPVLEEVIVNAPFVELRKFTVEGVTRREPVLIVAPLSGHHSTLLRETVATFLQDFDVYVTDWKNCRDVPFGEGVFGLNTNVRIVREFIELLGKNGNLHVVAVCQPAVPVLGAVSLQAKAGGVLPKSTILIGGPIDTRINPTKVNEFANAHSLESFARHTIHTVQHRYKGYGRNVYPGFIQLKAFLAIDPDRHIEAHRKYHQYLLAGDKVRAAKHQRFYKEYLSVMDLPGDFFLDTISTVFQRHLLPLGEWVVDGVLVDPGCISKGKLLTVEGADDNIVGRGQTEAAHDLVKNMPKKNKRHHLAPGAGHYGIFSGGTFSRDIYPLIRSFILK